MGWTFGFSANEERELLSAVCARADRLRLSLLRAGQESHTIYTRFLMLRKNDLLLYWPTHGALEFAETGRPVECYFEVDSTRFAFLSETLGRTIHVFSNGARAMALRLLMPDRIEKRQQRSAFRVSLNDLPPIEVEVQEMRPDGQPPPPLRMRLVNLSTGGLGCVLECGKQPPPQRRAIFEAHFRLPGVPESFAVLIELMHVRKIDEELGRHYLGWRIVPSDDALVSRELTRRLERFVADRQRALARRAVN